MAAQMTLSELLLLIRKAQNAARPKKLKPPEAYELWIYFEDEWRCASRLEEAPFILGVFNASVVPVAIIVDFGGGDVALEINELAASELDEFQLADLTVAIAETR